MNLANKVSTKNVSESKYIKILQKREINYVVINLRIKLKLNNEVNFTLKLHTESKIRSSCKN
jgi:hypothetical protein